MAKERPKWADAVEAAGFEGMTWERTASAWWGTPKGHGPQWRVDTFAVEVRGCVTLSLDHDDDIPRAMRLLTIGEAAIAAALAAEDGEPYTQDAMDAQALDDEGPGAFWRPCSGCCEVPESSDGSHMYPKHPKHGCLVGAGCSECNWRGIVLDAAPEVSDGAG
jgi:hypothetical protein